MLEPQTYLPGDFKEIKLDAVTRKRLAFRIFNEYAGFLLQNRLSECVALQMKLFREINPPLLRYFSVFTQDELVRMGNEVLEKLLLAIQQNQAPEYIENALRDWLNNQLPQISRNQVEAEDITSISLIRRRMFRTYISEYTNDLQKAVIILNEIDDFTTISETVSFKFLISLQQNLFEQNQKLAKIGNWVWDLKKNFITWSKEIYRIYEIPGGRLTEIDLASYNHPEDAEKVKQQMEISKKMKTPHDFFYRILLPDSREKTVHAIGEVITNSMGEAETMFGTLQDITDQKKIQKELEENQFFVSKITELTPSIIGVYNIHTGEYLFINQAIQNLLGYDRDMALKQGVQFFIDIMHPQDLARIHLENAAALSEANKSETERNENIIESRYRLRHKNGEYRWFYTYGSVFDRDKSGNVEKVINISIDVTDQIKTKSLLQQRNLEVQNQEERYFRMINEVEDYAILRLSRDGIIENWNSGAEKIKGYKAEEILGKHFSIFYAEEDKKNHLPEKLIRIAAEKGKATHEGWRVRKNKTKFWGSILITALHDSEGTVVGFSKVTRDLTEIKLAKEKLEKYAENIEKNNRHLEEKNKQLESFNYIASHDLQEPLRKIRLFINMLKEAEKLSPNINKTITNIEISSNRMKDLIEGLLLYCQSENPMMSESFDMDDLLNEVLAEFNDMIENRELEIEKQPLPPLNINKIQFRQVIYNLLSNSIKYKKDNDPLRLKITYGLVSGINGTLKRGKSYHKITFEDNGIGFDQEHAKNIFGLFQRLHDRTKYTGTGLGLAICKKIVENYGGEITAEGKSGVGARFVIYLPVTGTSDPVSRDYPGLFTGLSKLNDYI
jgi:PAS domain S-box-containing protein